MKKQFFLLFAALFMVANVFAQDAAKPKTQVAVVATNGLVGAAYSPTGSSVYLTFGGPGIKCTTGKFNFGVAMYPSMRFRTDNALPNVSPALGGGFNIGYDRYSLIIPFYLTAVANTAMAPAFGLAVRIGK